MSEFCQIFQLTSNPCQSGEDQQRFWRRLHRQILNNKPWWKANPSMIWVDLIYEGNTPYSVYLTLPEDVIKHMPHFLRGKEKRIKRKWSYPTVNQEVLRVPSQLSVCELKLGFDNIFSLPDKEIWLPERLPLRESEKARVSFGITPTKKHRIDSKKHQVFRSKMESGFREYRGGLGDSGLFSSLLYALSHFIFRLNLKKEKGVQGDPFLSKETIRKMNDAHFKVCIRMAAPQRVLPKLAIPMQNLKGENELKLQFLTKKEQKICLNEINKQKLGFYSLRNLNPNLMGGRELSYLFPFISNEQRTSGEVSRPNFQ